MIGVTFISWEEADGKPELELGLHPENIRYLPTDEVSWTAFVQKSKAPEHLNALYNFVTSHGLKFNGQLHQMGEKGVPLFSDGKVLMVSMRTWGHYMALIWNQHEKRAKGDQYSYMDFYC